MKKIFPIIAAAIVFAALALFPAFHPSLAVANTTNQSQPGSAGRPSSDLVTQARIDGFQSRQITDCSLPTAAITGVTATSSVVNITQSAGLDWATNKYAGKYVIQIVNTGATNSLIAFVSMTSTPLTNVPLTNTSGVVVTAGTSTQIEVSQRDGLCVHLRALPATVTFSALVGVCTE